MKTPFERGVKCKALQPDGKCNGISKRECGFEPEITKEWFTSEFQVIERGEICGKQSVFGNEFVKITQNEIEALKEGKILFLNDGEYGCFVAIEEGETHHE